MTGGRIKDAVTGLPRQMGTQLELATRDYRTHTRLTDRTVGTSRGNRMTGGMLSEERVSANAHTLYSWGHRTVRISKAGNRVMTGGDSAGLSNTARKSGGLGTAVIWWLTVSLRPGPRKEIMEAGRAH